MGISRIAAVAVTKDPSKAHQHHHVHVDHGRIVASNELHAANADVANIEDGYHHVEEYIEELVTRDVWLRVVAIVQRIEVSRRNLKAAVAEMISKRFPTISLGHTKHPYALVIGAVLILCLLVYLSNRLRRWFLHPTPNLSINEGISKTIDKHPPKRRQLVDGVASSRAITKGRNRCSLLSTPILPDDEKYTKRLRSGHSY